MLERSMRSIRSAEASIAARNRRCSSSARLRSKNWPIWLPIASIAFSSLSRLGEDILRPQRQQLFPGVAQRSAGRVVHVDVTHARTVDEKHQVRRGVHRGAEPALFFFGALALQKLADLAADREYRLQQSLETWRRYPAAPTSAALPGCSPTLGRPRRSRRCNACSNGR